MKGRLVYIGLLLGQPPQWPNPGLLMRAFVIWHISKLHYQLIPAAIFLMELMEIFSALSISGVANRIKVESE
jgi:hypothetical protein